MREERATLCPYHPRCIQWTPVEYWYGLGWRCPDNGWELCERWWGRGMGGACSNPLLWLVNIIKHISVYSYQTMKISPSTLSRVNKVSRSAPSLSPNFSTISRLLVGYTATWSPASYLRNNDSIITCATQSTLTIFYNRCRATFIINHQPEL